MWRTYGEGVMDAKRADPDRNLRIIFRHLIPATFGQIVVVSTLAVPSMILAETALSYLGLGLQPPITSWGVLLTSFRIWLSQLMFI